MRSFIRLGVVAVAFTLVGMLIATQMDFTAPSVASPPGGVSILPVSGGKSAPTSPFVPVIEKTSNAVVAVNGIREERSFFGGVQKSQSAGTAFFFRPDGYLLTNNHVVEGAEEITIQTEAGFEYEARLVGLDQATDLAVLKIDTDEEMDYIEFGDSDSVKVGEWAIAIGNPFPNQGLRGSVSVGVVSALGRAGLRFGAESPNYQSYIQVDASINPGNSGGPLINLNGEVIGVNSAISSPTGASVGIGFAIPINIARSVIPDLIAYGEVRRGWLGVQMAMVTQSDARRFDLDEVSGVVVEEVIPNSPASRAGLRVNDVIVEYNGHKVTNPSQFSLLVSMTRRGEEAKMKVLRNRERLTLTATITDRKTGQMVAQKWQKEHVPETFEWMGLQLQTMTRSLAQATGLEFHPGVLVTRVYSRSPGYRAGFEQGDILTEVGNTPVNDLDEFKLAIRKFGDRTRTIPVIVVVAGGDAEYRSIRP